MIRKLVHNVLFMGSPGTGNTRLALRLPTLLPSLTPTETTRIYSALGTGKSSRGG
jgi:predicted ATPase with chaperone activity